MAYNYNTENIGIGAIFPITLTQNSKGETGWYPVDGDISLIENNLRALIDYIIGFRIRQEEFGTRLVECLEEPNTSAIDYIIKEFLKQSIGQYEPRLKILKIITDRIDTKLHITLEYSIVGLSTQATMDIEYDNF